MVMKATKKFVVVAYDITATKRRNKVVSILEKYGIRSNKSVFECMLTENQLAKVIESIGSIKAEGADLRNPQKRRRGDHVVACEKASVPE